jgi:hypothetical protein
MATVREVKDRAELVRIIEAELQPFGFEVKREQVLIERYLYDDRIKWDTYLISIAGYGVWGMADGPL